MAGVHNGPIPTQLTLLSNLPSFQPSSKVRFLGCVTEYSTKAAVLTLEHDHPPGNSLKARVDVKLLANSLGSTETRIGEWINVLGYRSPEDTNFGLSGSDVLIQAIMLWPAGPLDLKGYERSLDLMAGEKTPV